MKLEIIRRREQYVSFVYGSYTGNAKVFDEPSDYGINNGRISMLEISGKRANYQYDRGTVFGQCSSKVIREIVKALEKLPPHLRELFVWRHINELSYDEIAEIKGLPVGTVKNRVFHSKELIRQLLEGKK